MVAQAQAPRLIESYYGADELETASPGRRLGGYLLEYVLAIVTLGIGWIVWFIVVAPRGQTPAKPGSTEPATRFGCRDTQTGAPLKLG